jgi:hypothetical protein
MTTQPEHRDGRLVPRPERTPEALRARDLDTATRLRTAERTAEHTAEHTAQSLDRADPAWRRAMDEIRGTFATARSAVNE